MIEYLPFVIPFLIILYVVGGLIYTTIKDFKEPPEPIHYVWTTILAFDSRDNTKVYYDPKDRKIRGKVVHQSDGLYRAIMWNGDWQDFIFQHDAITKVEEYKPRVYK